MYKPFEPQPQRFWEKYAIVPFFLAFLSVGCGMGYLVNKEIEKEQEFYKEWYSKEKQQYNVTRNMR